MITEAQLKADKAVTASRDSISVRLVVEALRGFLQPGLTAEQLLEQIGLEPGCLRNPLTDAAAWPIMAGIDGGTRAA